MLESDAAAQSPCTPKLYLDDCSIPRLPPPVSSRGHSRSRTSIEIPTLLSRSPSHSPTRSSTFLPFFTSSRSSSPKRAATPADVAEFTIQEEFDEPSRSQKPTKVEKITSWFEGSSEPVNIGLVASPKQKEQPLPDAEVSETLFSGSQESVPSLKDTQLRPIMQSANSSTSRFSFFSRKPPSVLVPQPDELASLSIKDTLFPDGPVEDFSPAAFKALQQNAENALQMFQNAYRDNLITLRRAVSEKNDQADELEASQTRNEHLKAQLLEIANRAAGQERLVASLTDENEQLIANEAALRSIRVITDHTSSGSSDTIEQQGSIRRNRLSNSSYAESIKSASTDVSATASVFSNDNEAVDPLRSPGTSVGFPSPVLRHACRVITPNIQHSPHVEHLRSLTTNIMVAECQKCHGMRSQEAWEVLDVMKAESAAMKERIRELETVNESAVDLLAWRPIELDDIRSKYEKMRNRDTVVDQ